MHLRKATAMRRRDVLAGAGSLAAGATLNFPAPAIAQGIRQLKMVTDWPDGTPGLHTSAVRLAQMIGVATGGRIKIEVFPAGALVRPFETFDAVGAGVADVYHSDDYYFEKKSPAFNRRGAAAAGPSSPSQFSNQPNSSSSSTSRPRRSGSKCRPRCSRAPTR
jgi:TRAP-type mannitol/chloroaromatic compound transport system substrate-binding protein